MVLPKLVPIYFLWDQVCANVTFNHFPLTEYFVFWQQVWQLFYFTNSTFCTFPDKVYFIRFSVYFCVFFVLFLNCSHASSIMFLSGWIVVSLMITFPRAPSSGQIFFFCLYLILGHDQVPAKLMTFPAASVVLSVFSAN